MSASRKAKASSMARRIVEKRRERGKPGMKLKRQMYKRQALLHIKHREQATREKARARAKA